MTHHLQGQVTDYDVDGSGTSLEAVLIAYAEDCRKAAKTYQTLAADLLIEALRAEAAATAAGQVDGIDSDTRSKP